MKRLFLALAGVALLNVTTYASIATDKEADKQAISSMLKETFVESGMEADMATPFADCIATKCVDNLNDDEVKQVLALKESEEGPSEVLAEKLQEYIIGCAMEMQSAD